MNSRNTHRGIYLEEEKPLIELPTFVWIGIVFIALCLGISLLIFPCTIVLLIFVGLCLAISVFFNLYIGLLIFLIGAYIHPTAHFVFLQQFHIARSLAFVILLIYLFHTMVYRDFTLVKAPQNFLLLGLIFFQFLSTFKHFNISFPAFFEIASKVTILYFAMVNLIKTRKQCLIIIWFLVLLGVTSSLFAFYQYASGMGIRDPIEGIIRTTGFTSNPNVLATELVLLVPFAISLYVTLKLKLVKLFLLAVLLIIMGGIVLTFSRAGFLGLSIVLFLSFWRFYFRNHKKFSVLIFSGLIFTLAILAIIPFVPNLYWERMKTIPMTGEAAIKSRLDGYKVGTEMMLDYPFVGAGYNYFMYEFWDRTHTTTFVSTRHTLPHAHNLFINTGAESGIFSLLLLVLLIFYSWRDSRKSQILFLKEDNILFSNLAQATEISLIGFVVLNMFTWDAYLLIFWIILSLAVVFKKLAIAEERER